jgi:hypothetical protein
VRDEWLSGLAAPGSHWLAARQAHADGGLAVSRAHLSVTRVRSRDFAHDEQSEAETLRPRPSGIAFLAGDSLERVEQLVDHHRIDRRSGTLHFENHLVRLTPDCHVDDGIGRSVLDRVQHEVTKQLLNAPAIPFTTGITANL